MREQVKRYCIDIVRHLDEMLDEEDAHADSEPTIPRDYEELKRLLPVFCVSSESYQILQGKFGRRRTKVHIQTESDTEIPQLIEHLIKVVTVDRHEICLRILNELKTAINSIHIWAVQDGDTKEVTEEQASNVSSGFNSKLGELTQVSFELIMSKNCRCANLIRRS